MTVPLEFPNGINAVKRSHPNSKAICIQESQLNVSSIQDTVLICYIFCLFYHRGHIEDVYDLCWSPDGNNLISGSVDNSAIIWDIVKGAYIFCRILIADSLKYDRCLRLSLISVRSKTYHPKGSQALCPRSVLGSTRSICGDKFQWQVIIIGILSCIHKGKARAIMISKLILISNLYKWFNQLKVTVQ